MEFQKVFVKEDVSAVIKCPNCRKTDALSPEKCIGKHRIQVKCTCGFFFGLEIDFRKTYRKKTDLDGYVVRLLPDKRWPKLLYESRTTNSTPRNCKITSLSTNGITLNTVTEHGIEIGDDIKVKFALNNSASTEFEKKAHVIWVKNNYMGCEFFDMHKNDVKLAFYLL